MATNVEVDKNNNENNVNLLRRFTKRVQGSGVLTKVRSIRYYTRLSSKYTTKKMALKRKTSKEGNDLLIKLGKIKPVDRTARK